MRDHDPTDTPDPAPLVVYDQAEHGQNDDDDQADDDDA
jgi:hypothetical protein